SAAPGHAPQRSGIWMTYLIESLESRRLLAATPSATLNNGVLLVVGTDQGEQIYVNTRYGTSFQKLYHVDVRAIDSDLREIGTFHYEQVNSIYIRRGAGDDFVNEPAIIPSAAMP